MLRRALRSSTSAVWLALFCPGVMPSASRSRFSCSVQVSIPPHRGPSRAAPAELSSPTRLSAEMRTIHEPDTAHNE